MRAFALIVRSLRTTIRPRSRWFPLIGFGLLFSQVGLWSIMVPVAEGLDEPAHVINAASVVRGQVFKSGVDLYSHALEVFPATVPGTFADGLVFTCSGTFPPGSMVPITPAECYSPPPSNPSVVHTWTYVGQYQPLYYLLVGLPSLVGASTYVLYAMRLVSALLAALLLTVAVVVAARYLGESLASAAIAIALTPMVLYLCSGVQPNGIEIASAISLWICGAALIRRRGRAPWTLAAAAGASAAALSVVRPISPVWDILILMVLTYLCPSEVRRRLWSQAHFRRTAAIVVVCVLGSVTWIVARHGLTTGLNGPGDWLPPGTPASAVLRSVLGGTSVALAQMVGAIGAQQQGVSLLAYLIWIGLLVMVAYLIVVDRVRDKRGRLVKAWTVLAATVVLLPGVAVVIGGRTHGAATWFGRYSLPIAVGLPLLLAFCDRRTYRSAFSQVAVVVAGTGQAIAFLVILRGFTTASAPTELSSSLALRSWQPPLSVVPCAALFVVVTAMVVTVLLTRVGPVPPAYAEFE